LCPGSYHCRLREALPLSKPVGALGWKSTEALAPEIGVDPLALEATLYPNEVITATLWLTNDGAVDLSFFVYETAALRLVQAAPVEGESRVWDGPIVDPHLAAQMQAEGQASAIIYLRKLADLSPAYGIADKRAGGNSCTTACRRRPGAAGTSCSNGWRRPAPSRGNSWR